MGKNKNILKVFCMVRPTLIGKRKKIVATGSKGNRAKQMSLTSRLATSFRVLSANPFSNWRAVVRNDSGEKPRKPRAGFQHRTAKQGVSKGPIVIHNKKKPYT
ncbi:MAG: hypothetical protein PHD95_03225 [Candidatus ainarchaeum sp.]|nr:hypothetical protein [Candidatus ainarchaeum sp.]